MIASVLSRFSFGSSSSSSITGPFSSILISFIFESLYEIGLSLDPTFSNFSTLTLSVFGLGRRNGKLRSSVLIAFYFFFFGHFFGDMSFLPVSMSSFGKEI